MPEPIRRMEVFTGAGRRRSWSAAEKAAIVAESYGAGETVCGVARRHGLTPQQLFSWRRLARQTALSPATDVRAGGGGAGSTGAADAGQDAAPGAPPIQRRWDRARDRRGRSSDRGGCEAAEHRGGDSRAEGDLVIGPSGNVRVLVATKPVDFRKGAEGLAALVREAMRTDPFSGVVYVFRAKRADRVKLIFWDGTGVVLVAKRLENGKFSWPAIDDGVMRLSAAQLQALLEGLDWRRVHEARRTTVPTAAS